MLVTYRFSQESELLSGVLQKLLAGRTELKLRTATELEKYVVARLMLSEVLQRSLGPALLVDAYPEGQLT